MKESTKPRIGRMLGDSPSRKMDKVELRRCEKLARQAKPPAPPSLQTFGQQGRWGRRFRLPGRPEANFSHLLTLGAMLPPWNTANSLRLRLAACGSLRRALARHWPAPQKATLESPVCELSVRFWLQPSPQPANGAWIFLSDSIPSCPFRKRIRSPRRRPPWGAICFPTAV